jgi:ribonuclease HII
MMEYRRRYPEYGFEHHKGYATAAHFAALGRRGALELGSAKSPRSECRPHRDFGAMRIWQRMHKVTSKIARLCR